jgi:5'-nucleotidase (lipoprotein e(P4) family)
MRKIFLVLPLIVACGGPAVWSPTNPAPVSATTPESPRVHPEIHWARNSAEHRAIYLQTYRLATDQLRVLARGKTAGRWAVILDADETVLDNSTFQKRRADLDSAYSEVAWNAWVNERAATALPGAVEFTRTVRELGGKVVIVTNRDETVCSATRQNISSAGIPADLVLCKPAGGSDKNPRFRAVQEGTAAAAVPALQVVMWVGDNIQDFPGMSQAVRDSAQTALGDFGRRFILLPNPMYGSWERNTYK